MFQREPRLFRKPQCRGVRRIGHREDEVGVRRRVFHGQPAPEAAACAVHRSAEHAAVGPGEVHELEHALVQVRGGRELQRAHAARIDGNDLTGKHFANDSGADDVQGARLGGEHGRVPELPHHERSPAVRVAGSQQRVVEEHKQRVRALQSQQCLRELLLRLARV